MTNNPASVRRIPTISRVCEDKTLIELVYDPAKRTTALAVSRFDGLWNMEREVQVGPDELLVPYSASNNLIRSECVLLPSVPLECGHKHELIADIRAFLHRYVDLSEGFEEIAAYYVLLTWVYDRFGELPYLRLRGEYGTGKTRTLLAIGSIAYRSFFASGASTISPIFHVLDRFGGTLILDESDLSYSDARADFVKVLNNGTVRGMPVLRCVPNRHKEYNPQAFKVFGPKVIAMRGSFQDPALESRFITENTGGRALRPDVPIYLPDAFKAEALALRNRLLHFRLSEYWSINPDSTALIGDADPRLNQMALAILSLVDDPEARRRIERVMLTERAQRLTEERDRAEIRVLAAALAAFDRSDGATVPVSAIAYYFNEEQEADLGSQVSNRWIGSMLRSRLFVPTYKSAGVYVVSRAEKPKLEALAIRYGLRPKAA